MTKLLTKFRRNEEGATAIEYGLIAALVAIALITALNSLSGGLSAIFTNTGNRLSTEAANANTTTTP